MQLETSKRVKEMISSLNPRQEHRQRGKRNYSKGFGEAGADCVCEIRKLVIRCHKDYGKRPICT